MNQSFLHRRQSAIQSFMDKYNGGQFNKLCHTFALGFMCSTALASPILFEEQGTWRIDVFGFFLSSATFMLQNQDEIKTYPPFLLGLVFLLGIGAFLSVQKSPKDLVAWLPPSLCVLILIAVYILPKLRQLLSGHDASLYTLEEGHRYVDHASRAEPGSIQSYTDIEDRLNPPRIMGIHHWLEYDTAHAGSALWPESPPSRGSRTHESEIDLDENQSVTRIVARRMVSPSRQGYNTTNLPGTALEGGPSPRSTRLSSQLELSIAPLQGSISPDSEFSRNRSSGSPEVEEPLVK